MTYAPCAYCGNEVQPANVLNCHGCGAPLKYASLPALPNYSNPSCLPGYDLIDVTTIGSVHKEYIVIPQASASIR